MRQEIRCCCSRRPLLGVVGQDGGGEPYIHVKAHKQKQLISEVVVTSGTAHIHCRSCNRWHRITIRQGSLKRIEEPLPQGILLQ